MEEKPGKGYNILPVMLHDRYERPAVAGPEIGFIKFRDHLPREIIMPVYAENLPLKTGEAQGGEFFLPPAPAEMKDIEMGNPGYRLNPVIGQSIRKIRCVECFSVEGNQRRAIG